MANDKDVNVVKGKKGFQPVTSGKKVPLAPEVPHTVGDTEDYDEDAHITTVFERFVHMQEQSAEEQHPDVEEVQRLAKMYEIPENHVFVSEPAVEKQQYNLYVVRPCTRGGCAEDYVIVASTEEWQVYRQGGFAQDAFPTLDAGAREILISGCCPECFARMFPSGMVTLEDEEYW